MARLRLDLSVTGRGRVVASATVTTILIIAISLWVTAASFESIDPAARTRLFWIDIIAPIAIAFPIVYFLMSKIRQLAIAQKQLAVYASTDMLTQVMNRAAFSTLVEAYLKEVRAHEERKQGALLIIDADNFKTVNDRFGHDTGDEALVTIARSIKSTLRAPDLVGRLGGEEFGVFLPGASPEQATLVAERIRQSVSDTRFMPTGAEHSLSVSVGGAVFERELPYAELFRLADQQLYAAKRDGRNRVAIAPIRPGPISLVAA